MKIAIKVITEWDRENVIPFFEKHFLKIPPVWEIDDVSIGSIFWLDNNEKSLFMDDGDEFATPPNYTILEGVPKDLELPKVDKEYSHLTNKDEQLSFLRSAYDSLNHDYKNLKSREQELKIYRVEFDGVYPVGNCLVIAAYSQQQAEEMASNTIAHTDKFVVNELTLTEPQIIEYLSGDY